MLPKFRHGENILDLEACDGNIIGHSRGLFAWTKRMRHGGFFMGNASWMRGKRVLDYVGVCLGKARLVLTCNKSTT